MTKEITVNNFVYSTDKTRLDVGYIHGFLSNSYWAKGIPISTVQTSIDSSLCIGIYHADRQVGFARLVTDYSTIAYLADVFVDENYRGRGVSKELVKFILSFDFIPALRRVILATRDAHGLYKQFGFESFQRPDRWMEIHKPDVYATPTIPTSSS